MLLRWFAGYSAVSGQLGTMFSSWRSQGWQYCGVIASRRAGELLAPPRWYREPLNTSTEPAVIGTMKRLGRLTRVCQDGKAIAADIVDVLFC